MVRQAGPTLGNILDLKDKTLDSPQAIDSFVFDNEIYKDIYSRSPHIQDSVAEGDSIIRTYPELAQDIFMSLYKHKPMLHEDEDVRDTHKFNRQMMDELMQMDDFRKLRSKTRLDMVGSALGFEVLSQQAISTLTYYQEEMKRQKEEQGDPNGKTAIDELNDYIDGTGGTGSGAPGADQGPAIPGGGQGQGKANGNAQQNQQLKNQANQQSSGNNPQDLQPPKLDPKQMDDLMNQMKKDMQKAAKQALDDVNETRQFLDAWGIGGGDPNNRISYEEKKSALQRLRQSPKVRKLTDLLGHMKKLAINEQKQKAPEGAEAIKSVKTGNEITAILPSELAQLSTKEKALKKNFYRKFQDKELLEYDKDVYQSMGKGPMIVCVDTSGSMSGGREMWSKAVALALLEIANKQKRNYACIHYDSRIQGVWEIPHGQLKPDDVFDIAERFSSGGTDFEKPLRKSMEIMKNNKFSKGDIVFITDGDCYVSDEFLEEFRTLKKQKEFQVHSVLIDAYGGGAESGVKEFSDKIIPLSNLSKMGDTAAKDIFRNV